MGGMVRGSIPSGWKQNPREKTQAEGLLREFDLDQEAAELGTA